MATRRVVTRQAPSGRSGVAADDRVAPAAVPYGSVTVLWGYDEGPFRLPSDGAPPSFRSWFPPSTGLRVLTTVIDPGSQASSDDYQGEVPGDLADAMAHAGSDRPGFHTSDTVDIGVVLSGEVVLELDDGEITLSRGDVVIQNGTAHAWRPSGTEPCEMAFVVVGATRA
jgi:mannose-6-phosphate isomerase-like protein (cupin superfamily)